MPLLTPSSMTSLASGIPQSDANPIAASFGYDPAAPLDQATPPTGFRQWQEKSLNRIESTALDFSNFHPDKPPTVRNRALTAAYLHAVTGQDPGRGPSFDILRDQVAREQFEGVGIGDDAAFATEIQTRAKRRRDAQQFNDQLIEAAAVTQLSSRLDFLSEPATTDTLEADPRGFRQWLESAQSAPGYDPRFAFEYLEAWNETRLAYQTATEAFIPELRRVWAAFELGDNPATIAREIYDTLPEEETDDFLRALKMLPKALPEDQATTFRENFAKQSARDLRDLPLSIREGLEQFTLSQPDGGNYAANSLPADPAQWEDFMQSENAAEQRRDYFRRRDFLADVQRINYEGYDPVRTVAREGSTLAAIERGIYAAPGAVGYSAIAVLPFVGQPAIGAAMLDQAYTDTRRNLIESGMSAPDASRQAANLAPFIAAPSAMLERLGGRAVIGKVPWLNRAMTRFSDRITNPAARFGGRFLATGTFETAIENAQDLLPSLAQELAAGLQEEIPSVDWEKTFEGYAHQTLTTFTAVAPLAIIGAAGGIPAEARARTIAQATDTELLAAGYTPDAVANLRKASEQGPESLNQALDDAFKTLDPTTPEAREAAALVDSKTRAQLDATQNLITIGVLPTYRTERDGTIILTDTATGAPIGTATSPEEAIRLTNETLRALDLDEADSLAQYVQSHLEAAQEASRAAREAGAPIAQEFSPAQTVTVTEQADRSADDAARLAWQTRQEETADTGTAPLAQIILGQHTYETLDGIRQSLTKLHQGSSILTVFHEKTHADFRRAIAENRITQQETLELVRSIQRILADKTVRTGSRGQSTKLAFHYLPQNDADVTLEHLDEAVAEIMEAEILRTRKHKDSRTRLDKGVFSKNLSALAKLASGATQKFRHFIRAMRRHFGLVLARARQIDKALAEGTVDRGNYDDFVNRLLGIEEELDYDQLAREAEADLLDDIDLSPVQPLDESEPFSLGHAQLADTLALDAINRIKDPVRRVQAWRRAAEKFEEIQNRAERLELLAGTKKLRKELLEDARHFEAARLDQLENEAMLRHHQVLSDPDFLTKITERPAHALLTTTKLDKNGKARRAGRLLSRTRAVAQGHSLAEYDGSEGASRIVFGGTLTPDQALQEMVDEGILSSDATLDDFWNYLAAEARDVARMKEHLDIARADFRDAREQAKGEANEYLSRKEATQNEVYSEKREILRLIAYLDTILKVLPPEIRGRLGGYDQLARLGSNESRLAFLRDRIDKVDQMLEAHLRETYDQEMQDLLARTRPEKGEAGEKPRGRITPELHDLFREVEAAMNLTPDEKEAMADALEAEVANRENDLTERERHFKAETAGMIRLAGAWGKADAGRREAALEQATRLFEGGYLDAWGKRLRLKEHRDHLAEEGIKGTGKDGTAAEIDARKEIDAKPSSKMRQSLYSLYSWEQMLGLVFGQDSELTEHFASWEQRASFAKTDAIALATDKLETFLGTLAGGNFKGEELRYKLANTFLDIEAPGATKRHLSELEAIQATLLWQQEDGQRHMIGHLDEGGNPVGEWHYNQAWIDNLESKLSKEAKAVRLFIREQYGQEYDRLNAVYSELYGLNLPRVKKYAPITVKPQQETASASIDPVTGQTTTGIGLTPGSLKTRSQTAIAEPNFTDSLQTFLGHTMQMEHWMAYAPLVTEALSVLNRRNLGNAVAAKASREATAVLRNWIEYFGTGGNRDAGQFLAINRGFSAITNRFAAAALVGRISVLAIQSTQLGAALAEIPTASYLKRLAKITTGQLSWRQAMRSDYIQRRLKDLPPQVRQALEGLSSSKPNRIKYAAHLAGKTIAGADALFTAGTYAILLDYHAKHAPAGVDPQTYAAEMAARGADRVAQPVRPGARSLLENRSNNPAMRLLWAFSSEARQKLALTAYAIHSKAKPSEIARAAAVTWLVGGAVAAVIRATLRDIRNSDDDEIFDDRNWNPVRLAVNSLAGPFQGLPLIGSEIDNAAMIAAGERPFDGSTLFGGFTGGVESLVSVPDYFTGDKDVDDALRDFEKITNAAGGASGTAAGVASFAHVLRDFYGIADNIREAAD